jgi:AcrR family transcriptional regulator
MSGTPNVQRTARTRALLIEAARASFATEGYAAASTPRIADEAGVSRGALYHHFDGKPDLFRAVVEQEQRDIATAIERAVANIPDPVTALRAGGDAYLDAMRDPGRRRILLVEGPAILGTKAMREIDQLHGGRTLAEGIGEAIAAGVIRDLPVAPLADLLSAIFERTAEMDDTDGAYRAALWGLMEGIMVDRP